MHKSTFSNIHPEFVSTHAGLEFTILEIHAGVQTAYHQKREIQEDQLNL